MDPPRFFLDTNVFILAVADPSCAAATLVRMATRAQVEVVVSESLLKEASRVFRRRYGRPSAGLARRMIARMPAVITVWAFEWSHLAPEVASLVTDKSDVNHVCAALTAGAHAFVTEDSRLAQMPIRTRLRFLTPAEAVGEARRREAEA
jgi:predicted nucleic acid-binding protein